MYLVKIKLIESDFENHMIKIVGNTMKDLIKVKYDGDSINHNSKIQLTYSKPHSFELMGHFFLMCNLIPFSFPFLLFVSKDYTLLQYGNYLVKILSNLGSKKKKSYLGCLSFDKIAEVMA